MSIQVIAKRPNERCYDFNKKILNFTFYKFCFFTFIRDGNKYKHNLLKRLIVGEVQSTLIKH